MRNTGRTTRAKAKAILSILENKETIFLAHNIDNAKKIKKEIKQLLPININKEINVYGVGEAIAKKVLRKKKIDVLILDIAEVIMSETFYAEYKSTMKMINCEIYEV